MLPSPAWPKHGISSRYSRRSAIDEVEQLRHAAARDDDIVVDLARRQRAQRDTTARAAPPRSRRDPRRSPAVARSSAPAALAGARTRVGLLLDARGHAVDLDDQHRAGAAAARARGRRAARPRSSDSRSMSSIVAGTHPRRQQQRHRMRRPRRCRRTSPAASTARGLGHQPQRDLRDDRQRALRPDQQLRQVVADDVLDGL